MRKAIVETIIINIALGAALLVPAGSLSWPMAWVVIAFYVAYSIGGFLVLPVDLIVERSRIPADASPEDLAIAGSAFLFLLPVSCIVCALDRRFGWSPVIPPMMEFVALAGFVFGYVVSLWAAHSNPFFSAVVRVQRERGHEVVAAGPYAWIRHPGYAGGIVAHVFMPLALGSLWGLLPAALGWMLLAFRIVHEERVLREGLPGYAQYADRVRWRLFPGVW
jgi:protein-S-isoprenylcysteine O-methyltransferase Ste14